MMRRWILRLAAVASATLFAAGAASAQSNTLSIVQDGAGNTLTVDQSRASGSTVGGLSMSDPTPRTFVRIIERDVERPVVDPAPGEPTTVTVREQETQSTTLDVLSATERQGSAARQIGVGNRADVTITGLDGFVGLLQDSGSAQTGNRATVDLRGGSGLVGQEGSGNEATMLIGEAAAAGTILQNGTANAADLRVTGVGASGLISQVGTGLVNNLDVAGNGTSASLYANGVGLADAASGVSVISNGATVVITQGPM